MKFKTKPIIITLVIISLLFGLLYIYHQDDELHSEAALIIDKFNQRKDLESNAYVFALGMHVAEDLDPVESGKQRQIQFRKYIESGAASELEPDIKPDIQFEKLKLLDKSERCDLRERICIENWLTKSKKDLQAFITKHDVILTRYHQYLSYETEITTLQPALAQPLPSYHYSIVGHRLFLLSSLLKVKQEAVNEALNDLYKNYKTLLNRLDTSDNLIHKMIFAAKINMSIDFMSALAQNSDVHIKKPLSKLSKQQVSLRKPFEAEFAMQAQLYFDLMQSKHLFSTETSHPKFLSRFLVKPNRSINDTYNGFVRYFDADELSPQKYLEHMLNTEPNSGRSYDWRNFVGHMLTQIGTPELADYPYRMFDINQKIHLFNRYIVNKTYLEDNWSLTNTKNSYYPNKSAFHDEEKICLNSPASKNPPCLFIFSRHKKAGN